MKIMAIDYGDVRTGVAVSDESLTLTGDAWVISSKNSHEIVLQVIEEAKQRGVSQIVVGFPRNMDGTVGTRAKKCEGFAESLRSAEKHEINIILWDERLTTISANRILSEVGRFGKKRKKKVDAVAASLILESYLNHLKTSS